MFNQLLRIMRLIPLLLLCTCLHLSATSWSQTITLQAKNQPITTIFNSIEKQSGYHIIYNDRFVTPGLRVSIDVRDKPLEDVLETVLKPYSLTYFVKDRTIAIRQGKKGEQVNPVKQLLTPVGATLQQRPVSGRVVDNSGVPLSGVTVGVRGSVLATTTDDEGRYRLEGLGEGTVLVFSMIGYQILEHVVQGQSVIDVVMQTSVSGLDEIVVVGYGEQRRSEVTGAISSVSAEQLNKMPTISINEMLRGAAPGVQVTMGSGAPGASSSILIRGRRSLSAGNDPLYIVDGVPTASVNDVNANEIASVDILKDASAQSIYGARAANGVILITTKRGVAGKTKVNVNSYAGVQDIYRNFEFYNGEQWAAYRKEAFYNAFGYYDEGEAFSGIMGDVYRAKNYVDWEDVMLDPAWQNKNDVLIQAGNEKTKYALSLGHFYQDGIVPSSDFQRFTGRLNVDQKLSEKISLGSNIAYTKSFRTIADGSFNAFVTMPPLSEVYHPDGSLREDVTEAGESHYNPLWNNRHSDNLDITDRLNVNFFGDWKIMKNLSYRLNTSLNTRNVQENSYIGLNHSTGRNNRGRAMVAGSIYTDYLVEKILNYDTQFGKHQFDATAMASINGIRWKRTGITGLGFANDDLSYHAVGSAESYVNPTYEFSDRKLLSYLARARYNYDSRYLLNVALRVDGSSVFGANNKYGYFPSVAFAWRAVEESFLKDVDFLSDLKLRLSYGSVGNQGISPYTTLGLANRYITEFGDNTQMGYLPSDELTNPNLRWETSTSTNLGLDFGFFNGRINGALELYDTQTTDLLVRRSLSTTSGYSSQLINLGHVQNRGIELALNTVPVNTADFKWDVGINFTANRNKIKKIDGRLDDEGNPVDDLNNNWFIGRSMNVYFDYEFDGIWQLTDDIASSHMPDARPGNIRVRDINDDNVISTDDRVIIDRDPNFITSFITSVDYKNFHFSMDIYYLTGGNLYNSYLATFGNGGDLTGKRNGVRRNYWTIHNPSNEAPVPNFVQAPAFMSSLAYEKANFVRLRNVSLSYTLPTNVAKKMGLDNLRLFSTMTNIWTWTNVSGYGPEQSPGTYPEPRTTLFGLNFSF